MQQILSLGRGSSPSYIAYSMRQNSALTRLKLVNLVIGGRVLVFLGVKEQT